MMNTVLTNKVMHSRIFGIPLVLSVGVTLGPYLLYGIAIRKERLRNAVPFISDTGMEAPEAPIFTILFNLGALMVAATVYIRHLIFHIKYNIPVNGISVTTKHMNQLSKVCGALTVLGLIIIGNFRSSEMNAMHNFGTYITCLFGTFDILLQSRIAFKNNCKKLSILRLLIVLVIIPSFLGYIFIEFVNNKIWNNVYIRDSLGRNVAAICEWIGFCMFGPFYATFIPEFKQIKQITVTLNFNHQHKPLLYQTDQQNQPNQ